MAAPRRALLTTWVLILGALPASAGGKATLHVRALDAWTGAAVRAEAVVVPAAGGGSRRFDLTSGAATVLLEPGLYRVELRTADHRPLTTNLELVGGLDLPVAFELEPIVEPPQLEAARRLPLEAGTGLLQGFVTDEATASVLGGVTVSLSPLGAQAVADENGYFQLTFAVPPPVEGRPVLGSLLLRASGYRTHEVSGVLLRDGATLLREVLTPGEGQTGRDDTPKVMMAPEALSLGQSAPHPPDDLDAGVPIELGLPVAIDPPDSIRVGTSCSCANCSSVSVMSLETYVRRGLNDEWISSWNAQSLRSGAVAYRSYGSYYVGHPISASYDICSTACCQVNDSDTSTSTNLAVDRTAGYLLERNGSVFRAEYSAENNSWDDPSDGLSCVNSDLSCGDGWAGSPAASWPCLSEPQDAGHGCFGHGRGACQWGTQRWASGQAKLWKWIVDHYYNDDGVGSGLRTARMTTPITLGPASPSPAQVAPGQSFTISASATNAAEVAHGRILVGASLYSAATGYVDDPANDTLVTLSSGGSTISRPFAVPAGTPNGLYDLLVSLYDDVDENGAIGGSDFALQLASSASAVRVCAPLAPAVTGRNRVPVSLQVRLEASAGYASYQWSRDGSAIPGATGPVLVTPPVSASATFRVDVSDAAGCTGSAQIAVEALPPTFADVPPDHPFYVFVEAVARDGITRGCGGGSYCPAAVVPRAQAAVLLLRARDGSFYTPPACSNAAFGDVPCSHPFAAWIYELVRRGITQGCGNGNYCPDFPVTRAQAAVLLLRTREGASYSPPGCTNPAFGDVPCSDPFAGWIYELVARGVTSGCGGGHYCPASAVTRGQAAVFLVRTFAIGLVW